MDFTGKKAGIKLYSQYALDSIKISHIEGGTCIWVSYCGTESDFYFHVLLYSFLILNNEDVLVLS